MNLKIIFHKNFLLENFSFTWDKVFFYGEAKIWIFASENNEKRGAGAKRQCY